MEDKLAMYESLIPLAGIGIWERDLSNNKTYWNKMMVEILEADQDQSYTIEQIVMLHKYPESIRQLMLRAQNSAQPETMVSQLTTFRKNVKWVRLRIQAQMEQNNCTKIYGTIEDITREVNIVSKLQSRDQRFSHAFQYAPNGMALVSMQGNLNRVNLSIANILGYQKTQLLQKTYQQIVHAEDLSKILDMISSLIALTKRTDQAEIRFLHQKGYYIWTMLNLSMVHDDLGKPNYLIFQLKDIDERIKNRQLIKAQNSRLQNFAHIISHNLRSHSGNIHALAEMAINEPEPEEKNHLMAMVKNTSSRLLETLENLNEIVKMQQQYPVATSVIMVEKEVNRVLDILAASINQCNAVIELDIPYQEEVIFNPAYFESIIINLVTNAIKYKHPQRDPLIKLTMRCTEGFKQLSVADNGIGIDLTLHKDKIFRLYKTFHHHPDSRGVGLYLVKQQIEELGGSISVESRIDDGTRFILSFPNRDLQI